MQCVMAYLRRGNKGLHKRDLRRYVSDFSVVFERIKLYLDGHAV